VRTQRRSVSVVLLATIFLIAAAPRRNVLTVPLPSHTAPLRFIVTGDAGTGDAHLHNGIVALTKTLHIDAILLVGDNVYPCGVTSVDDPQWKKMTVNFADAGVPIYPVLGNHDYGDPTPVNGKTVFCGNPSPASQVRATGHLPHWNFPARNYALRSPIVDIVMIDTQPIASEFTEPFMGSETLQGELDWVASALNGSGKGWRIAIGHHTIYSSGVHDIGNHRDQRHLRADLLPILLREHVDLYICGHDHDAELIGNLKSRGGAPVFLIAGAGAHSEVMEERHRADEPPTIFPASFPPKPLVGFNLVEITPTQISITFYDGLGKAQSDKYTIRR